MPCFKYFYALIPLGAHYWPTLHPLVMDVNLLALYFPLSICIYTFLLVYLLGVTHFWVYISPLIFSLGCVCVLQMWHGWLSKFEVHSWLHIRTGFYSANCHSSPWVNLNPLLAFLLFMFHGMSASSFIQT